MDVSVTSLDQSSLISTAISKDFQLMTFRNYPGLDPDNNYVWWYGAGNPVNFSGFDDPDVNRLLDAGRATPDPTTRQQIYGELNTPARRPRATSSGRPGPRGPCRWTPRSTVWSAPGPPTAAATTRASPSATTWRSCGGSSSDGCRTGADQAARRCSSSCCSSSRCSRRCCSASCPGDPVDTLVPLADSARGRRASRRRSARTSTSTSPCRSATSTGSSDFITGDENGEHFGEYFRVSGRDPVSERLADALPVSLQLMVYAQVLALVVAIPLGVFTAYRAGLPLRQGGQHRGVRPAGGAQLRARARPRLLPRGLAQLAAPVGLRPLRRRPRRARPAHDPAGRHAGRGPDRRLHAPAAQRHDGRRCRRTSSRWPGRRASPTSGCCGATPCARRASRC